MASGQRSPHAFWDKVPLEVVAGILAAAFTLVAPLRSWDEAYVTSTLRLLGSSEPPKSVIVVALDAARLRDADCSVHVAKAETSGKPKAVLFIPPTDSLCPAPKGHRWHTLDLSAVRLTRDGDVIGFEADASGQALRKIGVEGAEWVSPFAWRSVPSVNLSDLVSGRLESEVLNGRVVVMALEHAAGARSTRPPLSAGVAAALAAALEHGAWRVLSRRWLVGLVLCFCLLWYALGRWQSKRIPPSAMRAGLGVSYCALLLASVLGAVPLISAPSVLVGLAGYFALSKLPRFIAERRAARGTRELLSRARDADAGAPHALPAHLFWERLAKRVARAHPADGVLVAELPPFSWRLFVHPHGDLTEAVIRERRRDIRRWPYVDEHGKRNVNVTADFVVTNVPTVLVPMETAGEVEGYLFLIGQSAENAYIARSELTLQLAEEAAILIRQRRLEQQRAEQWRRPAGVLVEAPDARSQDLLMGARAAFDRLQLYGEVLDSTSIGLMYADAFGDVRVLNKPFRKYLSHLALEAPQASAQGMLPGGALPLPSLLERVAEAARGDCPTLDEITDREQSFEISLMGASEQRGQLVFRIARLENSEHGGFVASLVEMQESSAEAGGQVNRIQEAPDPLTVFSLSQLLVDLVDDVKRRTSGRISLQTPRVMAHVFGHKRELLQALEEFLVDAMQNAGKHEGPTLVVKERQYRVELSVLDLRLGVPVAALRRTLMAPSEPPPGLDAMGGFARAVENSHGTVALRTEDGWGARLSVSLVRARPRLEPATLAPVVDLRALERGTRGPKQD
jgi:hypothetical protein